MEPRFPKSVYYPLQVQRNGLKTKASTSSSCGSYWRWGRRRIFSSKLSFGILYVFLLMILYFVIYYPKDPTSSIKLFEYEPKSINFSYNHEVLLIDKRKVTLEDVYNKSMKRVRNILPLQYYSSKDPDGPQSHIDTTCARFPKFQEIEFSNTYWQVMKYWDSNCYLLEAYYDNRALVPGGPVVRILGQLNSIHPSSKTKELWCQLWFDHEREPQFSKITEFNHLWVFSTVKFYEFGWPYLFSCQVPKEHEGKVPISVSIVKKPCDHATNTLRVQYDVPKKKKSFAVCAIKGFDYANDLSTRLVEWIELLGLLGASKIYLYELYGHPNNTKVLNYYEAKGQIEMNPESWNSHVSNDPGLRHLYNVFVGHWNGLNEVVPLNACFYRNMYKYDYIAYFDMDEFIMPVKGKNWAELLEDLNLESKRLRGGEVAESYTFKNTYFTDGMRIGKPFAPDIPKYMHILQHVYRAKDSTHQGRGYTKSLHNTEKVLAVFHHWSIKFLRETGNYIDKGFYVDEEFGFLAHYRKNCADNDLCSEYMDYTIKDTKIWEFKEQLIERTRNTLKDLGFLL